jgi:hypothetical protein
LGVEVEIVVAADREEESKWSQFTSLSDGARWDTRFDQAGDDGGDACLHLVLQVKIFTYSWIT